MPVPRSVAVVAGVSAITLGGLFVAAPASAATLPDGQQINVIDFLSGTYSQVDPVSAALTSRSDPGVLRVTGLDVNDDGAGYAITAPGGDEPDPSALYAVDAATGVLTFLNDVVLGEAEYFLYGCSALDLTPGGQIVAVCYLPVGGLGWATQIGTIDPSTGILTNLIILPDEDEDLEFSAIATDPVTGQLWGFSATPGNGTAYLLDLAASTATPGAALDRYVFGADFDRGGQLYVSTQEARGDETGVPAMATLDPITGTSEFVGYYTPATTEDEPIENLTVWGKAALPATGPADVLPTALGTALLFLAGAAFLATARASGPRGRGRAEAR